MAILGDSYKVLLSVLSTADSLTQNDDWRGESQVRFDGAMKPKNMTQLWMIRMIELNGFLPDDGVELKW